MKVLFVNEYAQPVSGAEYSQNELAQAVKAKVFSPKWFSNNLGQGVSPLWFNNPLYYLYSAWQIGRQQFDLIHVHGKYILPGAVMAGWIKRKPVIITVRDFKFLCPLALCFITQKKCSWDYFIKQEVPQYQLRYGRVASWRLFLAKLWQLQLKWWLNRAGQVIAVSPQLAKIYQDNGVKNVIFIYNLPPKKQIRAFGNLLLSIGKLSYGKGTDVIIEAAKLLPKIKFIFAGQINPSFNAEFPKNCQYLGQVSHDQALKLYAKAGVFVINSRWPEPLSRAGLEALSFGLPIIASNRGGNQELVKENGFLVNPESSRQIAAAINKALKQSKWGENSQRLLISRFNRRQITTQHLNLYRQLCFN